MTNPEGTPLNLSRAKHVLALIGYGVHRRNSDQPGFHRTDFENALPTAVRRHVTPSRSHLVKVQASLSEAGYMSLTPAKAPRSGPPRIMMTVEEAAIEPFIGELINRVTHDGLTLPDILHIPDSVEAVLEYTDFKERVIARVSGLAIEHS